IAMVSRPAFNPNEPFSHQNLMLVPQYPGSVFKVVTAAAAIQNNIISPTETFNCNQNPYGDGPGNRRLGPLNFEESFYQSCNYTFGSLANRMMETDSKVIDRFASMLGLTQKVGWTDDVFHFLDFKQISDEGQNVLWGNESDRGDPKAIAQTAIGQRNVKLTPLSIANMMATIARGGEKRSVRVATEIDYHKLSGVKLTTFPQQDLPGETIDRYTAMKLESLLRGVVKDPNGTGHRLSDALYPIAGKSGTAETGHGYSHSWFAGYFPADDPKYVMVVVDLRHQSGTKTYDIYEKMVNELYHLDNDGN
ncbi:MAG: penicillin-binding transpeptidase domain-containing protein, partial [Tuberibacillus sp.]